MNTKRKRLSDGVIILCLFCLALLLRITLSGEYYGSDPSKTSYIPIAIHLARGEGFSMGMPGSLRPSFLHPPLYPYFLSLLIRFFGNNFLYSLRWAQGIIDSISALLLYITAKRIFDRPAGIISAFIYAIYLPYRDFSLLIEAETLITFFQIMGILTFSIAWEMFNKKAENSWIWFGRTGMLFGCAGLIRGTIILFPFFWFGFLIFSKGPKYWKDSLQQSLVILAGIAIVVTPWVGRNILSGGPVNIATGGAYTIWINHILPKSTNDSARGSECAEAHVYIKHFNWIVSLKEDCRGEDANVQYIMNNAYAMMNYVDRDHIFAKEIPKEILHNILHRPIDYIAHIVSLPYIFWLGNVSFGRCSPTWNGTCIFSGYLPYLLIIIGSISQLIIIIRRKTLRRKFFPFIALLLYFTLMHIVFYPNPRYNMQIFPILIIFSSLALWRAICAISSIRYQP